MKDPDLGILAGRGHRTQLGTTWTQPKAMWNGTTPTIPKLAAQL